MAETGNKWQKIILIIVVIVIILSLLIALLVGLQSLKQFFKYMIIFLLAIMILFGLLYVAYLVFIKKDFKDIPATYKKKLSATAKLMRNNMLGDLFLSGDVKHNRIKMGKYYYLRVPMPKQTTKLKLDKDGNKIVDPVKNQYVTEQVTESVDIDCFIVNKSGILNMLFSDTTIIMVKPEDHDYSAIFNDVTIRGFNLVPLDNQFYTIDSRSLDIDISKGVTTMYLREVVHEVMRDLDKMVKQAMNLDSRFTKEKAKQQEFEIPRIGAFGGDKN